MTKRFVGTVLGALALLAAPRQANAQDVPLARLLVELIQSDVRLASNTHDAHFIPGAEQQIAPFFFNQQLVTKLATVPIGSPAGGFSLTFDPTAGVVRRTADSFGPAFAERALTNGKGRLTLGFNFQYSKYNSFEGESLDNGDVKFYLRHFDIPNETLEFEGDLVEAALDLDLSTKTTNLFANYGLTNQWDVALAVPIVSVKMDATVNATILRLATEGTGIHQFEGGATTKAFNGSGSATGIGDMQIRTKYRFMTRPGGGLAAGVDVRLPTGDADNLLGTGAAAATLTLIGSATRGRFSPHFNVGYTGSGSGDLLNAPNEFAYRIGAEYTPHPRVTLAGTMIGRTLIDVGRLELTDTTWTFTTVQQQPGSTSLREFAAVDGSLNLIDIAVGGKVNLTKTLLLSANVLIPVTSASLTASVTPVIGLDYTFSR